MSTAFFMIPRLGASQAGVFDIFAEYTSGATGAIPAALTTSAGLSAITRTGTGVVDFTFDQAVYRVLEANIYVEQATPDTAGACEVSTVKSSTKVTATFRKNSDYTAVDTTTGDKVVAHFTVQTVQT